MEVAKNIPTQEKRIYRVVRILEYVGNEQFIRSLEQRAVRGESIYLGGTIREEFIGDNFAPIGGVETYAGGALRQLLHDESENEE